LRRGRAVAGFAAVVLLIALARSAHAVEGKPCVAEPTDMVLQYGDLVTCAIDVVGDSDLFRFEGSVGEVVRVSIAGTGGPFFTLSAPSGAPLTGGGLLPDVFTLTQTGTHTILVRQNTNSGTAQYALALDRLAPTASTARAIAYGQIVSDEINPAGDVDLFVFSGAAGTVVRVSAPGSGGPAFEMFAPGGARLGGSILPQDFTLTQSGLHTILLHQNTNSATATYNLSVQCIAGACPQSVASPICQAQLNKASFVNGEVVLAQTLRIANPSTSPLAIEYKFWLEMPAGPPVTFARGGADGAVVLSPGFDQNFGPLNVFTVQPSSPRGTYGFNCRFIDPITGALQAEDLNTFTVQ